MQSIQQSVKKFIKYILKQHDLRLVKDLSARLISPVRWTSCEDHIFEYCKEVVCTLENDPVVTTRQDVLKGLRQLSLDDFGLILFSMPDPQYPKVSRLLPAMASEEVQRHWTGTHGLTLLKQTTVFVRAVSYHYTRITKKPLDHATVLDFGCGYGRIARLLYFFSEEEEIFGVDPWEQAIELCRKSGLSTNFVVSEYLPAFLPVGEIQFDLIYAFSVFTHLSPRAMTTALTALRKYIREDGVLAITIRPVEYWEHEPLMSKAHQRRLAVRHRKEGFAFHPHHREEIDGDVTYGDTSMTVEWIAATFPDWTIKATDRSLSDPLQQYVFLVPR